ncbi:TonB-dependent receptor [Sphingomonas sp. G-3-2-10]|uniref:TonB-dependent receptor plug domain-containing protein n=1 Tax=Sphingomonas sp. G-3-2-10 TaxID=2728838 RepID=UPI00146CBB02|nr:TonB-dependent receptor [Sphingomonas sp. G-3-2-10]NML04312.1 TonB-dependent receptor [Sphingomonas sp. G-3-2-10]
MKGKITSIRLRMLCGAACLIALAPVAAQAQDAPAETPAETDDTQTAADPGNAIVVTGSRIVRDGYQAPTPVTVATSDDLLKAAPASIPDGLNKLPQFVGSAGPNRSSTTFATPNHGNILNLRGLGGIRTLILIDGVRASPSTYLGTVNVDLFPQLLTQRVDIVTAGASASYGSDAVAGVVNFVLDTKFNGVKGVAQAGISGRGDNATNRLGLAGGFNLTDRVHVLLSYEHIQSDGYLVSDRPELAQQGIAVGSVIGGGAPGSASNPLHFVTGARYNFASFGGLVSTGPFANTVFLNGPNNYRTAIAGTPTGSTGFFTGNSDYYYAPGSVSASAATKSDSVFGRIDFEATDDVTIFAQFMGAKSDISYNSLPNLLLTPAIFSGNAFLPAPLQTQLTNTGTASFTLRKLFDEFGPITGYETIYNWQAIAGAKGRIGGFDWNLAYSRGSTIFKFRQPGQFEQTKLAAALDAVFDGSGNIVCRPTLSADPAVRARYAGCVPLNPFGYGSASAAARDYVMGTSTYRAEMITDNVVFGVSGDLFELPAGPLSIAVGGEYREQSLKLTSNSDPAVLQDNTGLRGLAANATRFYLTNTGIANGSSNVKEVFGEIAIPVLKDTPFFQSLDLSAAIRYADYSTSGGVTTWKLGGIWAPTDGLKFRATRSRDIRAPTLFDLFAGAQFIQTATLDPHTNTNGSYFQRSSGNSALKPEVADTLSIGLVAQPAFLPGFALSVDAYKIRINGAISTLSAAQILQDCEDSGGTAPSCAAITRPLPFSDRTAANFPTEVRVAGVNISTIETQGIDFDASYRTNIGEDRLALRLYATYVHRYRTRLSGNQPVIEYAGYSTLGGRSDTTIPNFKGSFSVSYEAKNFGIFVQEGLIGRIRMGPTLRYAEEDLPPVLNTDVTLTLRPEMIRGRGEFFLTVNNLFDRTPPQFYVNTVPGLGAGTLINLYDTTGRQFTAGVRFNF